jgi:hypothetical protein
MPGKKGLDPHVLFQLYSSFYKNQAKNNKILIQSKSVSVFSIISLFFSTLLLNALPGLRHRRFLSLEDPPVALLPKIPGDKQISESTPLRF